MDIMPKKEVKKVLREVNKQFGVKNIENDYVFIKSKKGRIFVVNKDMERIDLGNFEVNTLGLYVMKEEKDGIRLSIEGSQIFGPKATSNVLVLKDCGEWLMGHNVDVDTSLKGYVIVKCGEDFVGCGKIKNDRLINYIPKNRRISEVAPS